MSNEPNLIDTIKTGYTGLRCIICVNDEKLWTRGEKSIMKLYNIHGILLKSIATKSGERPHDITLTGNGDLLYTDAETKTVNRVKNKETEEVITLKEWKPYYICSTFAGDLLVTMFSDDETQSKVVRYKDFEESQTIQFDGEGKPLLSADYLKYITENRNGDICVADFGGSVVVVVDQDGILRFRYTGHPSTTKGPFNPYGITTDSHNQILVADLYNNCVHILDQDGQFLRYIDTCDLEKPWGLCVDTKDNLFVAECEGVFDQDEPTGPQTDTKGPFYPFDIIAGSQCQILIADVYNNCVYILNQDGHFLRYHL
ncbi:protein lin-41-like [Saccostrea echinata]|uniref:protein lin-41-like n=1 Tax=Saccostrea echinata TaxID=191078 RepID=UPI002A7FEEAD|nr:protein lin-41-like [Saccostrea echinata]